MAVFYIEYRETVTEVFRVEATSEKEAKEKVIAQQNHKHNHDDAIIITRKTKYNYKEI